jgi:hypothetical protein
MLTSARKPLVAAISIACSLLLAIAGVRAVGRAQATLASALTFHASFDNGGDADFGLGDKRVYGAASYRNLADAQPGFRNPNAAIAPGKGRYGAALEFTARNTIPIYYQAEKNVEYRPRDWSGTLSFWLSLDPDQDLTGYVDPIQITDKDYNNAALWVDFPNDKPRSFRLGVFPDLAAWNPDKLTGQTNPAFVRHLVVVTTPPFGRGKWTHVAFTYSGLNGQQPGNAKLYLNGKLEGTAGSIPELFTWDPVKTTIRLGVNYTGLYDDLSIFNRALSDAEVQTLYALPAGAAALHR